MVQTASVVKAGGQMKRLIIKPRPVGQLSA